MFYKGYGLFHSIYILFCLLITKLIYPKARLVRLPIFIRNNGTFIYKKGFTTGRQNRIDIFKGGALLIGENYQINDNCHIACSKSISIGDNVLCASRVFITDHDHDYRQKGMPLSWPLISEPVLIGDDCWIGEGVSILKGVVIGRGSIIGAGSVVTKSFPDYSVIVGNPAKLKGKRTR